MGALGLPTTGLCGCCCPAPQLRPRLRLSVRRATAQGGAGAAHISPWEEVELPSRLKAIILVNIPSHSAGANPWGSARSAVPQDYADGIIEVVGAVNALHGIAYLSLNKVLRLRRGPGCFKRLAQAAEGRRAVATASWHLRHLVHGQEQRAPARCLSPTSPAPSPATLAPTPAPHSRPIPHQVLRAPTAKELHRSQTAQPKKPPAQALPVQPAVAIEKV